MSFEIVKSVSGSFHQGYFTLFGRTAGKQCSCNALFSICWSIVKKISLWKSQDLDTILYEGDKIYKSLNADVYLAVDELPTTISFHNSQFNISLLNIETRKPKEIKDFLQQMYSCKNDKGDASGCLIFIDYSTIALMSLSGNYYLFDSHSRNERGLIIDNGYSVLLKFQNLKHVENYLTEVYVEPYCKTEPLHCQVQFVQVNISGNDKTCILSFLKQQNKRRCYETNSSQIRLIKKTKYDENKGTLKHTDKLQKMKINYEKSKSTLKHSDRLQIKKVNYEINKGTLKHTDMLKKMKINYEKSKGTALHANMLKKMKEKYELSKGTVNHIERLQKLRANYNTIVGTPEHQTILQKRRDKNKSKQNKLSKIQKFKMSIQEGPFYICIVCNRCLYKRSVLKFQPHKYEHFCDGIF